mmetsp:Transcript_63464/g.169764  ORF Transcript_63464/g.169764 Transcript_63464/m.169764 type:complete len:201 (-) Transcript_63464:1622-2224(-)
MHLLAKEVRSCASSHAQAHLAVGPRQGRPPKPSSIRTLAVSKSSQRLARGRPYLRTLRGQVISLRPLSSLRASTPVAARAAKLLLHDLAFRQIQTRPQQHLEIPPHPPVGQVLQVALRPLFPLHRHQHLPPLLRHLRDLSLREGEVAARPGQQPPDPPRSASDIDQPALPPWFATSRSLSLHGPDQQSQELLRASGSLQV